MNWHSKPTAATVVWMDLRPGKRLQPRLPAPQPDECAEHKVCSKPSKRTICENAILAQVWLRPGVPWPFDLHSSKRVFKQASFYTTVCWRQVVTPKCSHREQPPGSTWTMGIRGLVKCRTPRGLPAGKLSRARGWVWGTRHEFGGFWICPTGSSPNLPPSNLLYSWTHPKIIFYFWDLRVMNNACTIYTSLLFPAEINSSVSSPYPGSLPGDFKTGSRDTKVLSRSCFLFFTSRSHCNSLVSDLVIVKKIQL